LDWECSIMLTMLNLWRWSCACVGVKNWVILLRARYKYNQNLLSLCCTSGRNTAVLSQPLSMNFLCTWASAGGTALIVTIQLGCEAVSLSALVSMVPKNRCAFIFRIEQSKKMDLRSFETLGSTCPETERHIPEDPHLQQHRCVNLKPGNIPSVSQCEW